MPIYLVHSGKGIIVFAVTASSKEDCYDKLAGSPKFTEYLSETALDEMYRKSTFYCGHNFDPFNDKDRARALFKKLGSDNDNISASAVYVMNSFIGDFTEELRLSDGSSHYNLLKTAILTSRNIRRTIIYRNVHEDGYMMLEEIPDEACL